MVGVHRHTISLRSPVLRALIVTHEANISPPHKRKTVLASDMDFDEYAKWYLGINDEKRETRAYQKTA
jgi:hypothetical protein